jgi:hypothetical protein
MGEAAESACHQLLLRLAGRLSDRLLWRFRDWLAAGALPELSHTVPLTLLRERIGLTTEEVRLLDGALRPHGADVGLISSIRELDQAPEPEYAFSPESPVRTGLGDSHSVLLSAVLHGRSDVGEVRACWRRYRGGPAARRVLLVDASTGAVRLTGELQRVQRALGEHDPCVEVLPPDIELPAYHRAALSASELLCTGGAPANR